MNPLGSRRYVELCDKTSYLVSRILKTEIFQKLEKYLELKIELLEIELTKKKEELKNEQK